MSETATKQSDVITHTNKLSGSPINLNIIPEYPKGLHPFPENYEIHIPKDQQRNIIDVANELMKQQL